jgi:hypothetical protein
MKSKIDVVRTLKQTRTYILEVGICGILSDAWYVRTYGKAFEDSRVRHKHVD